VTDFPGGLWKTLSEAATSEERDEKTKKERRSRTPPFISEEKTSMRKFLWLLTKLGWE